MTLASPRTTGPVPTWRTRAGYWWIWLSVLPIAAFALRPYLSSSLQEQAAEPGALAATYVEQGVVVQGALYVHVFLAAVVLVLSPLQFSVRLRRRARRLHRVIGRVVLVSIAVAGVCGLVLAPFNRAGLVGTAGFGLLAVLWVAFAGAGFRAIRRRDVPAHRRWMVRTFALTYAGVTLRLWMMTIPPVVAALSGVDGQVAWDRTYLVITFLCWVPNLLVAELYLRAGRRRSRPDDVSSSPPSPTPSLHSGGVR